MLHPVRDTASFPWPRAFRRGLRAWAVLTAVFAASSTFAAGPEGATAFHKDVEPILDLYCCTCHNSTLKKGGLVLNEFESDAALLENRQLWWKVLKMTRAGMMPPLKKDRPSAEQFEQIEHWIKSAVFQIDPKNPDPGHVTLRRLNRVEYRNTIRDLLGVDFNADAAFPPDDTGHGFDNIGDVLSLSPLLLEKYLTAAKSVVAQAVPAGPLTVAEKKLAGRRFRAADGEAGDGPLALSYYKAATVSCTIPAEHAGKYQLVLDLTGNEKYVDGVFDYNKCKLVFKADGKALFEKEYSRQGGQKFHHVFDLDWQAGDHELTFALEPLTPDEKQVRSLTLRIDSVTVRGPLEKDHWVHPPNYERYFPKAVPESAAERRKYAHELLASFATRAFRRPAGEESVDRLVKLAESVYTKEGQTFEAGIAQAMTAVLASPRFLFREEGAESNQGDTHPLLDEYALASRLSYFLWSSMPDDELIRLAAEHKLRKNLSAQVTRMLADPRSSEFVRHFSGQWLQARDIESVEINARAVIGRDEVVDPKVQKQRERFRELIRKPADSLTDDEKKELAELRSAVFGAGGRRFNQFELTGDLRRSMRRETEMTFDYVMRKDRTLLELLDSDYTFLNEALAKQYGIDGVKGPEMRMVTLAKDSPRGGVLTQATVLVTTSNPDRTSPVKRGLFILDKVLGIPPAPPPPDIPPLEDAAAGIKDKNPTLRETLKRHRQDALCASCHNRMDPLGLALENFNALGRWRDKERDQPIEASGQLITGETFANVRELKHVLVTKHARDFYRCLTEKMLTYALGRGLEYYDVQAVDEIVARIEKEDGRSSALLIGIIESAPFQKRRAAPVDADPDKTRQERSPDPRKE